MWFLSLNPCRQSLDWAGVCWGRNLENFSYFLKFLSETIFFFFRHSIFIWKWKIVLLHKAPWSREMEANWFWAAFLHLKQLWNISFVQNDSLTEIPTNENTKVLKLSVLDLRVSDTFLLCLVKNVYEHHCKNARPDKPNSACQPFCFSKSSHVSLNWKNMNRVKVYLPSCRSCKYKKESEIKTIQRSTAKHKLLWVSNKWKRSPRQSSPMPYLERLSSVNAHEVLSNLLWSTCRHDALTSFRVNFCFMSLSLWLTFFF